LDTEKSRRAQREGSTSRHTLPDEPQVLTAQDAQSCSTRAPSSLPRAWTLRWLLYVFALAVIAPLLGFVLFATSRMIDAEHAAEEEDLRRTVRMLSAAIDRELMGQIERLNALAISTELKEADFAAFHRDASAALRGTGDALLLVDRNLNQLINTRVPYGTPLPGGDFDSVRKVFATGKPSIGVHVMRTGARRAAIKIMVPATIDGELRYLLVLSPDPGLLTRILDQRYLPDGWIAGVSDRNGRRLARSVRDQELIGTLIPTHTTAKSTKRSGVIKTTSVEGYVVLQAYRWSDVTGWRTSVQVPLAILEAPARQLWLALAAFAALAFAVSLLAAAIVGRSLARPIGGIATAAAALGRGDPVNFTRCGIAEVNAVGAALAAAAQQRKHAEEHLRFLMRELSHRTKNVMAVVQAISWQTAQKSLDLQDFEQRFTQRLEALARSQDLLVRREWRGVDLHELVRGQLEPFLDSAKDRLTANGPILLLTPAAAQELGLALHELATNASKYGALSVPKGKIEVAWKIEDETAASKRLHMTWLESGGPAVNPPIRKGFGFTVTTSSLSRSFKGEAKVHYRHQGVFWELTAPVGNLIAELHLNA
jgi:two-component sensor histidine kinase